MSPLFEILDPVATGFQPVLAEITLEQILQKLGPFIIAFFFFIVPLIRAIRESIVKQREARAARDRGESVPDVPPPDAGRKAWDDLMRGDAPAPVAPPPMPVSARTESARVERAERLPSIESDESGERTASLSGRLSDLAPAPSEDDEEASLDEERTAREANERALREEFDRRSKFMRQEREPTVRKTVAPMDLTTLTPEIADTSAATRVSTNVLGPGSSRAALRRALIAAEVLGRPVALREAGDGIGPISMRR